MNDVLTLTREEWVALITFLGVPEPFGITEIADDAPPTPEELGMGARSLAGRGLLDPFAESAADDVHPAVARLLVAMLDAEEAVTVSLAHQDVVTSLSWFAIGGVGVAATQDPLGNRHFAVGPLDDIAPQAQQSLQTLRSKAPAAQQHPITGGLDDALAALVGGTEAARLNVGQDSRAVDYMGTVRGWRQTSDDEVTEETVVIVGLSDGDGAWVVDTDGETPSLTQLSPPWPGILERLRPAS